jgi:hypothetical protein
MRRTGQVQGLRLMKFEDIYERASRRELSQYKAASILGISERTFRRWRDRFESDGAEGLYDRRLHGRYSPETAGTRRFRRRHGRVSLLRRVGGGGRSLERTRLWQISLITPIYREFLQINRECAPVRFIFLRVVSGLPTISLNLGTGNSKVRTGKLFDGSGIYR